MATYIWSAPLNMAVGCIFKHFRILRNLDQAEAAESSGLVASTISKLESGSTNITIEHVFILCAAYKVSLSDFARVIELAVIELHKEKVFVYSEKSVEKSEYVVIKDNTVVVKTEDSLLSLGASTGADIGVGVGIGIGASVLAVPLGPLGIMLGVAGASAYSKYKNNNSKKTKDVTRTELDENEEITLPKLSSKQVYSVLKDFFESEDLQSLNLDVK